MITNPILPIWLMAILCIILLFLKRKETLSYLRHIFIILLIFIINLRPMIPSDEINTTAAKMDVSVLFVIDNTISMLAKDYNNNTERLSAVKEDCAYIIDELYGADFSVISFDSEAKLLSPFTSDTDFAKNTISTIYPADEIYAKGSSMNTCKEVLLKTLENVKKKNNGSVAVFFISDGEITNNDSLESFSKASKYIDYGSVLGYGTKEGGKMYPKSDYNTDNSALQDKSDFPYTDAISKIDENNLKKLASDMKISYTNMNTQENIKNTLKEIRQNATTSTEEGDKTAGYEDICYWFALPLLLLLIYDFKVSVQRSVLK